MHNKSLEASLECLYDKIFKEYMHKNIFFKFTEESYRGCRSGVSSVSIGTFFLLKSISFKKC